MSVQAFAKNRGYAVITKRTNKNRKGEVMKVSLSCDRFRKPRATNTVRDSRSKHVDCPFELTARRIEAGSWGLEIKNGQHQNHEAFSTGLSHAVLRRRSNTVVNTIRSLSRVGIKPREIIATIRYQDPNCLIIEKDIYNEKLRFRTEQLHGLTPTQALLVELRDSDLTHQALYDTPSELEDNTSLRGLFFTFPWCEKMLQRHHEVLIFDNTYKNNRFGLPLMQCIGVSELNSTFPSGLAFLPNEQRETFEWVLSCYKEIGINPKVIVSDQDKAFRSAATAIFPEARLLLCTWHFNKNVLKEARRRWRSGTPVRISETEQQRQRREEDKENSVQSFMKDYYRVIQSSTLPQFNDRYAELKNKYWDTQLPLMDWIDNNFYPLRHDLVDYWANQCTHYGVRVSSNVEGAHAELKSFLHTSTGDLHHVAEKFKLWIQKKEAQYNTDLEYARTHVKHTHRKRIFRKLIGRVSPYAIDEILDQISFMNGKDFRPNSCTGQYTKSYGLPCSHMLHAKKQYSSETIELSEIDDHWKFERQPVSKD